MYIIQALVLSLLSRCEWSDVIHYACTAHTKKFSQSHHIMKISWESGGLFCVAQHQNLRGIDLCFSNKPALYEQS